MLRINARPAAFDRRARAVRPSALLLALATSWLLLPARAAQTAPVPGKPPRGVTRKVSALEKEARAFLGTLIPILQPVARVASEAAWLAATDVTPEHTGARAGADKVAAAVAGSRLVVERTRAFLARRGELEELTARQLDKLLLAAAEAPGTIPDVVSARIEAEARQAAIQDSATICLEPRPQGRCARTATANEIDELLRRSRSLPERERAWRASKEPGLALKPGLAALVGLRNQVARELGYGSFFALQVADYGMSVPEMMNLLERTLATTRPLFDGLHCFARHALAARFQKPPPRTLPAHWLGNRWAQVWPGILDAVDLDPLFKDRSPEQIVRASEDFYVALGLPRLPDTFWRRSDLYPVKKGETRKKNSHASAWHIDGEQDVRSLMSVEPGVRWFGTSHHELGHIYYYLSYARPEVPFLLRAGANRAFHEAIGELARLASLQTPYLRRLGLLRAGVEPEPMAVLLDAAMDSIVFLPFAAGTMSHFERDLYEEPLAPEAWQERWWQYVERFQGVTPPGPRPPDLCDACTKTHLNDDPAQYYDYALATLIKFQLHRHICAKLLEQDVRACDYGAAGGGAEKVGSFLRGLLALGATRDWRAVIRETTGQDVGPEALVEYFQPLEGELARRNAGRDCARSAE
jgi:peptidyl-dipeptidase A